MHFLMIPLTTRILHKLLSRPEPTVTYSYKLHGQTLLRKAIHASKVYNTKRIQSIEQLCDSYLDMKCSNYHEAATSNQGFPTPNSDGSTIATTESEDSILSMAFNDEGQSLHQIPPVSNPIP